MAATNTAADAGLTSDALTAVNTSLGGKVKDITVSGSTLTLTKGDGSTKAVTLPSGGATVASTNFAALVTN